MKSAVREWVGAQAIWMCILNELELENGSLEIDQDFLKDKMIKGSMCVHIFHAIFL